MFDGNLCETRTEVNRIAVRERALKLESRKVEHQLESVLSFRETLENQRKKCKEFRYRTPSTQKSKSQKQSESPPKIRIFSTEPTQVETAVTSCMSSEEQKKLTLNRSSRKVVRLSSRSVVPTEQLAALQEKQHRIRKLNNSLAVTKDIMQSRKSLRSSDSNFSERILLPFEIQRKISSLKRSFTDLKEDGGAKKTMKKVKAKVPLASQPLKMDQIRAESVKKVIISPIKKRNLSPCQSDVRRSLKSIILDEEPNSCFLTSPQISVITGELEVASFTAPASPRPHHLTTLSTFSSEKPRRGSHLRLNTLSDFTGINQREKELSIYEGETPSEKMRKLHSQLVSERESKKEGKTLEERILEQKEKELEEELNLQADMLVKTAGETQDTLKTILKRIETRRREKVVFEREWRYWMLRFPSIVQSQGMQA